MNNRFVPLFCRAFTLLLPALLTLPLTGCFMFGSATPVRYAVGTPRTPQVEADVSGLSVRMADDLRAAKSPLLFKKDGTVTRVPGLTYYAPVEVVLGRALREMIGLSEDRRAPTADLMVTDFCVDATGDAPVARVTLVYRNTGKTVTETQPLRDPADPAEVRIALAKALTDAAVRVMR